MARSLLRTSLLTVLTLAAFAGNSILCRLALREGAIDPWSFTALRLASGALVLLPFLRTGSGGGARPWSWHGALALFAYALGFSLAYVSLDTGTGALLLFGMVQLTMIGTGVARGERPGPRGLLGIAAAVAGVVWLLLPGASAPDARGALLMATAGIAWGIYSLLGRGAKAPSRQTACNFLLALPLALVAFVAFGSFGAFGPGSGAWSWSAEGVLLAALSGALTSGLGYVLWYATLPAHSATSAGVVQLAVPALAALGGVLLLGEDWTPRFLGAGGLTLGGIATFLLAGKRR